MKVKLNYKPIEPNEEFTYRKAIEEFLYRYLPDYEIKCAVIECLINEGRSYQNVERKYVVLKENYIQKEFDEFLTKLEFDDSSFDGIAGIIWFTSGCWAELKPLIDEEPELYGYGWKMYECPDVFELCKRSE